MRSRSHQQNFAYSLDSWVRLRDWPGDARFRVLARMRYESVTGEVRIRYRLGLFEHGRLETAWIDETDIAEAATSAVRSAS